MPVNIQVRINTENAAFEECEGGEAARIFRRFADEIDGRTFDPDDDEAIVLSPFIISSEKEEGWSANDTLSATRTKQALKDVPVNIDAITSDFMEDLGLFTTDDVANYVANAWAPPTMENDNQSGAIAFRGHELLGARHPVTQPLLDVGQRLRGLLPQVVELGVVLCLQRRCLRAPDLLLVLPSLLVSLLQLAKLLPMLLSLGSQCREPRVALLHTSVFCRTHFRCALPQLGLEIGNLPA